MCLLAKVPLVGVLLFGVLLVAEKERIPPGSVTLEKGKVLLFSGASPRFWYSWSLSSLVGWTGGHQQSHLWFLPMCQFADTVMRSLRI